MVDNKAADIVVVVEFTVGAALDCKKKATVGVLALTLYHNLKVGKIHALCRLFRLLGIWLGYKCTQRAVRVTEVKVDCPILLHHLAEGNKDVRPAFLTKADKQGSVGVEGRTRVCKINKTVARNSYLCDIFAHPSDKRLIVHIDFSARHIVKNLERAEKRACRRAPICGTLLASAVGLVAVYEIVKVVKCLLHHTLTNLHILLGKRGDKQDV